MRRGIHSTRTHALTFYSLRRALNAEPRAEAVGTRIVVREAFASTNARTVIFSDQRRCLSLLRTHCDAYDRDGRGRCNQHQKFPHTTSLERMNGHDEHRDAMRSLNLAQIEFSHSARDQDSADMIETFTCAFHTIEPTIWMHFDQCHHIAPSQKSHVANPRAPLAQSERCRAESIRAETNCALTLELTRFDGHQHYPG